ncbi:hypothetical protein BOTBODRAFT_646741 [Botryobasidium botryosum FD-172 SS1]|uniref:Uncharacterized protein n=1 Tax=Botryobasidium botryosum (strain FD-172 SS1) TaxID=930990 RepID=A0A067MPH5_BOTB1|nr:hypothetical protein BOTBODRAFT_646741 [Botryobasidium botryosum FD-172 SS1]
MAAASGLPPARCYLPSWPTVYVVLRRLAGDWHSLIPGASLPTLGLALVNGGSGSEQYEVGAAVWDLCRRSSTAQRKSCLDVDYMHRPHSDHWGLVLGSDADEDWAPNTSITAQNSDRHLAIWAGAAVVWRFTISRAPPRSKSPRFEKLEIPDPKRRQDAEERQREARKRDYRTPACVRSREDGCAAVHQFADTNYDSPDSRASKTESRRETAWPDSIAIQIQVSTPTSTSQIAVPAAEQTELPRNVQNQKRRNGEDGDGDDEGGGDKSRRVPI